MQLHFDDGVFWVDSSYEEREAVKAAGFLWHPRADCLGACAACRIGLTKKWWTAKHSVAAKLERFADEPTKAALREYQASLSASRAATVEDSEFDALVPKPNGLEYLPYQKAGIAYAISRRCTLFGDEMGLGKTIQALGTINSDPTATRVLIVSPASVKLNLKREAEKWLVRKFVIEVLSGGPPSDYLNGLMQRVENRGAHGFVIIINYDILSRWHEELAKSRYDWLIADEFHACKNPGSQRSRALLGTYARGDKLVSEGLVHCAEHVLGLTGTPVPNRPSELFPLLRALDQEDLGGSFTRFAFRYCAPQRVSIGRGRVRWDFSGASHLDELQERLRARVMIRRLKADVLKELPPKRRTVLELAPNGAEALVRAEREAFAHWEHQIEQLEQAAETAKVLDDEEAFKNAMAELRSVRAHAFEEIAKERHKIGVAKAPHVVEHVKDILEGGTSKVIVFAYHRDVINALITGLEKATGLAVLTGDTPTKARQEAVDRFQFDPETRVFIGNIQAAGVGITLTAADTVVFAELSWVPSDLMQAEDRPHRVGQKNSVLVQYLVFDGSLDAKMSRTLIAKMDIIERALDCPSSTPAAEDIDHLLEAVRRRPQVKHPPATGEQRALAKRVVEQLAGLCDGARTRDGQGFDRLDTRFGHELARRAQQRPLTDGEVGVVRRLAHKYSGQLSAEDVATLWAAEELLLD